MHVTSFTHTGTSLVTKLLGVLRAVATNELPANVLAGLVWLDEMTLEITEIRLLHIRSTLTPGSQSDHNLCYALLLVRQEMTRRGMEQVDTEWVPAHTDDPYCEGCGAISVLGSTSRCSQCTAADAAEESRVLAVLSCEEERRCVAAEENALRETRRIRSIRLR